MRLILQTESEIRHSPDESDTLRTDATTSCGNAVEISTEEGGVGGGRDLLQLIAQEARPAPADRPWLLANMVSSADGAASGVEGRSGSLSSPADRQLFIVLRSLADVVLAGAGTVRAENYGAPRLPPGVESWRAAQGQAPLPRLAVVSGRLHLDPEARLFQEAPSDAAPIVLTTAQAAAGATDRLEALQAVADIRPVGDTELDWVDAVRLLREEYDARTVLVEGGPTINAQLFDNDLLDELCLTIAPVVIGGAAQRVVGAVPPLSPLPMKLDRVFEDQGFLLLRYLRRRA